MADPNEIRNSKNSRKARKNKEIGKEEIKQITEWVDQIKVKNAREKALEGLSHKRESLSDLTLYIWYYRYSSNISSRNN